MKKSFSLKKKIGRKNIIISIVALVLIMLTTIATTYSWIEEVSEITFSTDDDSQQTPLHITDKKLNSTVQVSQNSSSVQLSDYFYESGDMHLSPCYSDGEEFYFPVKKRSTGSTPTFRKGTKDDENVNYISVTFKVKSINAKTAYWFDKLNSGSTQFFTVTNSSGTGVTNFRNQLRCSITVDNATTVYVNNYNQTTANATGTYKKGASGTQVSGAPTIQSYSYNSTCNKGKGTVNGHDDNYGNTLFNVDKYDENNKKTVKTVTLKIWLEYSTGTAISYSDGQTTGAPNMTKVNAKLSNINLQLTSSWAKTRTIYVKDETVSGNGHWVGGTGVQIWFAERGSDGKVVSTSSTAVLSNWQEQNAGTYTWAYTFPAVNNGMDVYLIRNGGWNVGDNGPTPINIKYHNYWKTTIPDTFVNETYSVYTDEFGTWANTANYAQFVNSCNYTFDGYTTFGLTPKAYMWDSNYGSGTSSKVVENEAWPGENLTKLADSYNVNGFNTYRFYYDVNTVYDHIIFNDAFHGGGGDGGGTDGYAHAYQTPDIELDPAKKDWYFDMATLHFYSTAANCPSPSDWFLYNNFVTGNEWRVTRFMVGSPYTENNVSHTQYYCRAYFKARNNDGQHYEFKISYQGNEFWGRHNSGQDIYNASGGKLWQGDDTSQSENRQFYKSNTLNDANCAPLLLYNGENYSVCSFYFVPDLNRLWVEFDGTNYSVYS
jgi:hypothetical protein